MFRLPGYLKMTILASQAIVFPKKRSIFAILPSLTFHDSARLVKILF